MSDTFPKPAAAEPDELPLEIPGEVLAGTDQYAWYAGDRALWQTVDDAEREYGPKLWDEMMNEPVLAASDDLLRILVLGDGMTLAPAIDRPDPRKATGQELADYDLADEICTFCRECLEALPRDPLDISWDMLESYGRGHKLAEINLDVATEGEHKGKIVLTSIKPKPKGVYAFVLDGFNNERGIIGKIPGVTTALWTGLLVDLKGMVNAVTRRKFFVLSFNGRNGDPRGWPALRPCYDPWRGKKLIKPEHLKFLAQFGGGMITAAADKEVNGTVKVRDARTGALVEKPLQEAVLELLKGLKNGGLAAFPPGVTITVHVPNADGQAFEFAFDRKDAEMVLAYLKQTRATREAKHGSKADSGTAQDLLYVVRDYVRRRLCDGWRRQVLRLLVELNWNAETARKFTPQVLMAGVDKPDFAPVASGIAALATCGWITEEQKPYYDELLGAPERDIEDEAEDPQQEDPAASPAGKFPVRGEQDGGQGADGRRLAQVDEGRAAKAAAAKRRFAERAPNSG